MLKKISFWVFVSIPTLLFTLFPGHQAVAAGDLYLSGGGGGGAGGSSGGGGAGAYVGNSPAPDNIYGGASPSSYSYYHGGKGGGSVGEWYSSSEYGGTSGYSYGGPGVGVGAGAGGDAGGQQSPDGHGGFTYGTPSEAQNGGGIGGGAAGSSPYEVFNHPGYSYMGSGGGGGGAYAEILTDTDFDTLSLVAGGGGSSTVYIGDFATDDFYAGQGGGGGNATVESNNSTIGISTKLVLESGKNGAGDSQTSANMTLDVSGGLGGAAVLNAKELKAVGGASVQADFTKKDGDVTVNAGKLNVTEAHLNLKLDGTVAWTGTTGVLFDEIVLGGGKIFSTTSTNSGTFMFNKLTVTGSAIYGNDLNVNGKIVDFDLPASIAAGSTMLTVLGSADFDHSTVTVLGTGGLAAGQSITLVSAGSLTADYMTIDSGVFESSVDGNSIRLTLTTIPVQYKAYAEGMTARAALLNLGADTVMTQGIRHAKKATECAAATCDGLAAFGTANGGSSRYKTGSHVDVDGFAMLVGAAKGHNVSFGKATYGAFIETGYGDYDSHNSFANAPTVKGNGDTRYTGFGVLANLQLNSGLYVEGSARVGRAKMDFSADNINGLYSSFDSSSLYYGLFAGTGYEWKVADKLMLDASAKFIWTHQEGDDVVVNLDRVHFNDIDSVRTRFGIRSIYEYSSKFKPYFEISWDKEYKGASKSSVNGSAMEKPSLKGDSGVFDLGLTITPQVKGLSMEIGIQGYVGDREGVSGTFQIRKEF